MANVAIIESNAQTLWRWQSRSTMLFYKVIPTVVVLLYSNYTAMSKKNTNYTRHFVHGTKSLETIFHFPPFLFFFPNMPKHTQTSIDAFPVSQTARSVPFKNNQKPTKTQGTQNHLPSSSAHLQWSPGVEPLSHLRKTDGWTGPMVKPRVSTGFGVCFEILEWDGLERRSFWSFDSLNSL